MDDAAIAEQLEIEEQVMPYLRCGLHALYIANERRDDDLSGSGWDPSATRDEKYDSAQQDAMKIPKRSML